MSFLIDISLTSTKIVQLIIREHLEKNQPGKNQRKLFTFLSERECVSEETIKETIQQAKTKKIYEKRTKSLLDFFQYLLQENTSRQMTVQKLFDVARNFLIATIERFLEERSSDAEKTELLNKCVEKIKSIFVESLSEGSQGQLQEEINSYPSRRGPVVEFLGSIPVLIRNLSVVQDEAKRMHDQQMREVGIATTQRIRKEMEQQREQSQEDELSHLSPVVRRLVGRFENPVPEETCAQSSEVIIEQLRKAEEEREIEKQQLLELKKRQRELERQKQELEQKAQEAERKREEETRGRLIEFQQKQKLEQRQQELERQKQELEQKAKEAEQEVEILQKQIQEVKIAEEEKQQRAVSFVEKMDEFTKSEDFLNYINDKLCEFSISLEYAETISNLINEYLGEKAKESQSLMAYVTDSDETFNYAIEYFPGMMADDIVKGSKVFIERSNQVNDKISEWIAEFKSCTTNEGCTKIYNQIEGLKAEWFQAFSVLLPIEIKELREFGLSEGVVKGIRRVFEQVRNSLTKSVENALDESNRQMSKIMNCSTSEEQRGPALGTGGMGHV